MRKVALLVMTHLVVAGAALFWGVYLGQVHGQLSFRSKTLNVDYDIAQVSNEDMQLGAELMISGFFQLVSAALELPPEEAKKELVVIALAIKEAALDSLGKREGRRSPRDLPRQRN